MARRSKLQAAYTLATLLALGANSLHGAQDSLRDIDVRVALYRPSDESERTMQRTQPTLTTITVPPSVDSVRRLLGSVHFYANSESAGLIYALNPGLRDPLHPGENVRMIQIQSTPDVTDALSHGFMLRIHYDEKIIGDIINSPEKLRGLIGSVSAIAPERFADLNVRQNALGCISSFSDDLQQIAERLDDRDQPTNHDMLLQVAADIERFSQTLGTAAQPAGSVTSTDAAALCAVAKDLKVKQSGFNTTRDPNSSFSPWPQALVQVRTVSAETGKPVLSLTVHFVPEALASFKERDKVFPTLSSPTEWYLPEADYILWAARGENMPPLGQVRVSVRRTDNSKPFFVDILVKQ